ncbi:MAG: hypothetical protein WAV76_16900 [Bacteroidota bacterium]
MAQFNQILSALGHKDYCNFKFFLAQVRIKSLTLGRVSFMENTWLVEIEECGKDGYVHYYEGKNKISFYWEFCVGPKILACLQGPPPDIWDGEVAWAKDRRIEIMHRIAEEVIRQKAPGHVPEYLYDRTIININAP